MTMVFGGQLIHIAEAFFSSGWWRADALRVYSYEVHVLPCKCRSKDISDG